MLNILVGGVPMYGHPADIRYSVGMEISTSFFLVYLKGGLKLKD
jgi:hypothetical protein